MLTCPVCWTTPNPTACECKSLWYRRTTDWSGPRGWNFGCLAVSSEHDVIMRKIWEPASGIKRLGSWVPVSPEEAITILASETSRLTVRLVMKL